MFESSFLSSYHPHSRRGLFTFTSFGLQALAVFVVLPLLRPPGLPAFRQLSTPVSLGRPLEDLPAARTHATANSPLPKNPADRTIRMPIEIPKGVTPVADNAPPIGADGPAIPGAAGPGDPRDVLDLFEHGSQRVVPIVRPPAVVKSVRLSHMSEGDLVRKIVPTYPPLARSARIQGQVVLQAVIGKQGAIENLRALSGHPMLVAAAIEAVRQWRYRPYILNNEPVEVETQITVNFSLDGNSQ